MSKHSEEKIVNFNLTFHKNGKEKSQDSHKKMKS